MLNTTAPKPGKHGELNIDFKDPVLGPATRPRKVLVVEDEPAMRQYLDDLLKELGYQVDTVAGCLDGLVNLLQTTYDYLVLDLVLPELNGLLLYNQVAHIDAKLAGRTVFITGASEENPLVRRAGEMHVPVLSKPFTAERLINMLGRVA